MKKNLVFVSAGRSWKGQSYLNSANYDVWVHNYDPELNLNFGDFYSVGEGYKWPNFLREYTKNPAFFDAYENIAVWDDDIELSVADVEKCFAIHTEYNLWVSQPSNTIDGKNNYECTKQISGNKLHYTNFVENRAVIFNTLKLKEFLSVYKGVPYAYGCDWFYLQTLQNGNEENKKYAVIDEVSWRNPFSKEKTDGIEANRILLNSGKAIYDTVKAELNIIEIHEKDTKIYSVIKKDGLEVAYVKPHAPYTLFNLESLQ